MTSNTKMDDLTGLHTREILEELDRKFSVVATDTIWSLMVIDIDHFKLVNDVFGRLQGDRVLQRVANILARNCRGEDTLLRYGGDEFVIVMPFTEQLKAVNQAERILQGMQREVFSEGMEVGLSIGVAESRMDDSRLAQIYERADNALYEAKIGGRGKVSFYDNATTGSQGNGISFEHFVGREQELSTVRGILNETVTGKGQFVLISGEPGIGKSRLAQELEHFSNFKECHFLKVRCDDSGIHRPYQQLTGSIARQLHTLSSDDLKDLTGTLSEILPQTSELFPGLDLKLSHAPSTDEEGVVKFKIYSEIFSILKCIATRRPVVFVVDNLQWISANDFDLLAYLARASTDLPILFLATVREPMKDYSGIQKKLRILSTLVNYTSIKLEKLDEEYIRHMVMFALRDPKIPVEVLQMLVKQSSGNPMYLIELLLSLRNKRAIEPVVGGGWKYEISSDLPLPETLFQLMSVRLENLDRFAREVLRTASLMAGGCFSPEPVSAVLNRNEFDIAKALDELLRLGLIGEKQFNSRTIEYHFVNETMRSYLLQELTPEIRKTLQSRFGHYYESTYDKGDASVIPLAAHHFGDSMDSARAMQFALLAMKQADERDAKREVLRWLELYMSFAGSAEENNSDAFLARLELGKTYTHFARHKKATELLNDAARFTTHSDQIGLLRFHQARLHFNMGDHAEAEKLYLTAIEFLPPGKETIMASLQIAFIQYLTGSVERSLELLQAVKEQIETIKDRRERKQLLATFYMRHGTIALKALSRVDSTEECLKAVTIYRQLNDRTGEAKALLNTAVSLFATSRYETRIDILNDALKVFIETGDTHSIMGAYINLGQAYYNAMEFDLSRNYFQRCLDLVEATGTKRFGVWANSYLAILDTNEKDFSSAENRYKKAIESADELGLAPMALNARMNLVTMLINKKDYEKADVHLTELEADEVAGSMDEDTLKTLRGYRGTERFHNPALERASALKQAEENLRLATVNIDNDPSIRTIDLVGTFTECLIALGRLYQARKELARAQKMFQLFLSGIDSAHYKQKMLESGTADKLEKLSKLLENQ
ncbi:MAG: diguanylate cyclase [Candidatus Fermentibacteria bacterium]|nr:diguanylate cyclase [Candidatus Fermentibacteria bacterium]